MAAIYNNTMEEPVAKDDTAMNDNTGLSQMHKWFLVTGSLLAVSFVLGIIYFVITHKNCVGSVCNGLRPDMDGERCRRQVLPEVDDLEAGQGQNRLSTHLFLNKWMSRTRSVSEHERP